MENENKNLAIREESEKMDLTMFNERNNFEVFTTLNTDDKDAKIKLYNTMQEGCDALVNDLKGTIINLVDVYIEKKDVAKLDEKTNMPIISEIGEIETETKFRTILFDDEGKSYASGAYGIYNSLGQIFRIFGRPTKENPIKVKIGEKTTRTGRKSLILTVVMDNQA